ncbi:MAG: ATP-binding protein [Anaerolineae bacterium]|nr:ATP-binding protein [Anaerolineae bacterium]
MAHPGGRGGLARDRPSEALTEAMDLMVTAEDPRQVPHQIAVGVATALRADVVVVFSLDEGWADVLAAYDHIQQRAINGLALNLKEQPTLVKALAQGQPAALLPQTHQDELADLYSRLDITQTGPAYFQPVRREGQQMGLILVALPYSGRQLQDEEQKLLVELAPIAAGLLAMADTALEARFAAEDRARPDVTGEQAQGARHELQEAREQIDDLTDMVRSLQIELDYERSRVAAMEVDDEQALTLSQQMEALRKEREQLAAERDRLHAALTEAQTTLSTVTAEDNAAVLHGMVALLEREKRELEMQRDGLRAQLDQLTVSDATPEAIAQMLQSLTEETERLANERDQISAELQHTKAQLKELGIEGGAAGLAQWLGQLYDERARLIEHNRQLVAERETEIEGEDIEGRVLLRAQVKRLANDREALTVQRDALRRERDDLAREMAEAQSRAAALAQVRDSLVEQLNEKEADLKRAGALGVQLARQRDELKQRVSGLESERDQLTAARVALEAERDRLRGGLEGEAPDSETLNAELQSVKALRDLVAELSEQRTALETELTAAQSDIEFLHGQLKATEEQLRNTEAAVETAIHEAVALRRQQMDTNAEVIASIAQELRTPMSSITGYTDLMLSESVGILGAMQRNFLHRVKANTERMGTLLDDLVRITVMESGRFALTQEAVDAVEVIEEAIMGVGSQFREKDITLRMDLADDLPTIEADRDALQQIMTQLLSNACQASPVHGEVTLTARQERTAFPDEAGEEGAERYVARLFASVTDQGGGVAPADVERVFSRKYRADNPLVAGVGDTGVGLSIAKALVEAHGGRIWIESEEGVGSTFCFVLPLAPVTQQET